MSEDYALRPAAPPTRPDPVVIPAPEQQISVGVADTPAGPRLAIVVTTLLEPAAAKQIGEAISNAAAAMPTSRIVLANGVIPK